MDNIFFQTKTTGNFYLNLPNFCRYPEFWIIGSAMKKY